jgi:hypothetical protein
MVEPRFVGDPGTLQPWATGRPMSRICGVREERRYPPAWSGTRPVPQPVFKTGEVWQPQAG